MSKLSSLLRATMSGGIQIFNYRGKTKRSRWITPIVLAISIGTVMLIGATSLASQLKETDGVSSILSIYILITVIIIVTEGIYKSEDLLFKPKDNDILLSMPIKKPVIIFSRIIKFYIFEMLYCLIFFLPALIAYAINAKVTISYPLVAITALLFIPIIPIATSCIIGLITSAISSKSKHKALIEIIISLLFLAGCAAIVLTINTTSDFNEQSIIAVGDKINNLYYPASAIAQLATHFDIWQYLLFIGINLGIIFITVLLISQFYFQIVTKLTTIKHNSKIITKYNLKKHSQTSAIIRKELTKYFKTPVWLTNTALGLMLFIGAVIAVCLNSDDIISSITGSIEDFPLTTEEIRSYLPSVNVAMVAFTSLLTFITAVMISLEGKAFNTLKSLPISGVRIIIAKVLSAMLLIVPITALGSLIIFIKFKFSIIDAILVLIAVVVMPLVTELVGILIDLKYARFDADNDAVTVRQSASVLISTFTGLGMVLFTISLIFACVFLAGQTAGLIIIDALYAVVALFLLFTVATRGEAKISKLSA